LKAQADEYRHKLLEGVAEYDDECLHQYLEAHEVNKDALQRAIRKGTIAMKCFPVLCGSAFKNKGVQKLLDAIVDYLPSPLDVPPVVGKTPDGKEEVRETRDDAPFAGLAFKIMADPSVALQRLAVEDPSFRIRTDEETGQTIISGMGELHLEIIVDRMRREYKVEANVGKPQVAYRETITREVKSEGKYIRQTGGRGQYG